MNGHSVPSGEILRRNSEKLIELKFIIELQGLPHKSVSRVMWCSERENVELFLSVRTDSCGTLFSPPISPFRNRSRIADWHLSPL